jgi:hypothetical protein
MNVKSQGVKIQGKGDLSRKNTAKIRHPPNRRPQPASAHLPTPVSRKDISANTFPDCKPFSGTLFTFCSRRLYSTEKAQQKWGKTQCGKSVVTFSAALEYECSDQIYSKFHCRVSPKRSLPRGYERNSGTFSLNLAFQTHQVISSACGRE